MTCPVALPIEPPTPELDRWLLEIGALSGLRPSEARQVFAAVFGSLISQLPPAEANGLTDQLPASIRQCMDRAIRQCRAIEQHEFVAHVCGVCPTLSPLQANRAIWAVFTMLSHHLSPPLIRHVRNLLPREVSALWNTAA
jgi:uncharacterized protein (DUF2267 family)